MRTTAGKKLLNYLYDNNIKAYQFACDTGASPAQISKYLRGESSPRIETAFRIKKATNGHVKLIDWINLQIPEEEE